MTQLFFLIHSGLLSLALIQFKLGSVTHVSSCMMGFWLGLVWLQATYRSQHMLAYWDQKLADLETKNPSTIMVFAVYEGKIPSPPGWSMDQLLVQLVRTFVFAWGGFMAYSLYALIKGGLRGA